MKFTKKCNNANQNINNQQDKRRSSAGMFYTSSAGAVTSLILMIALCGILNIYNVDNSYADYSVSMTSSGAQEIDVLPSSNPSGIGTKISSDAVTVSTTCPSGYNLTATTSVNNNNLYLNGNSSNNTEGSFFSPSNGTTSLGSSANTWGFYQNGSTVPTASSIFKAVPASGSSAATIRTGSTSGDDSFNIYYGVAVSNTLAPGTYKMIPEQNTNENGTIVYYLTMAEECIETKQYMQDVTEADLAELMPDTGDTATLYDKRDEQEYTVAKLADGKFWMTKNLNLDGGTALSADDTDVTSSYISSFTTSNNLTKDGNTIVLPASSKSGFNTNNYSHVYNSGKNGTDCSNPGCYSYYTWDAATLGSGRSISTDNTNATESICPKGWHLPSTKSGTNSSTDFRALMIALGGSASVDYYTPSTSPTGAVMYNKIIASPYNFMLTGQYSNGSFVNDGVTGFYWSSTSGSSTGNDRARRVAFNINNVNLISAGYRGYGDSVRCVKKSDPPKQTLYDLVATQSRGPQTVANLRTAITTENSGVYEYNTSVFGTASDAANTSKIYYYRGILDDTTGSYGSDGDNAKYPNTVVLSSASSRGSLTTSDTCWRIVRTTGSGGVKMIYQGKWTGSTCANATTNAQVTTSAFNGTSSTYQQIVRVGYTYNSTYAENTSKSGTIAQIFGSNSNPGANNTRSDIKTYIEDTWYANNMTSYTSKLEASAGYCNDRTMNTTYSWTSPLAESTTIASTYGTSGQQSYYFGAYPRNANAAQSPSLTCGNKYSQIDRSTVDLYRYVSGSTGVSNQLKYPAALLTADEAAFAGSGWSSSTTPYHANSFLRSGSSFWLLSPCYRDSYGHASGFDLYSGGNLSNDNVGGTHGVRPAISLTSGTTPVSGTGTATDPWIVNP